MITKRVWLYPLFLLSCTTPSHTGPDKASEQDSFKSEQVQSLRLEQGNIEIFDITFYNQEKRTVRVYLPPDYTKDSQKRYPLLVMFDGQNLFDTKTSAFGLSWKVNETLDRFFAEGKHAGAIVVGIDNAGNARDRYREYTAWDWTHPTVGYISSVGAQVADFIAEQVIPFIRSRYRVLEMREFTGIAGSSMGGYMALYTGIKHQKVFGRIASFSTVALDSPMNGYKLREFLENSKPLPDTKVYLDMGGAETLPYAPRPHILIEGNEKVCASLRKAGFDPWCRVIPRALHDEEAWAERFGEVFLYLFGKQ